MVLYSLFEIGATENTEILTIIAKKKEEGCVSYDAGRNSTRLTKTKKKEVENDAAM